MISLVQVQKATLLVQNGFSGSNIDPKHRKMFEDATRRYEQQAIITKSNWVWYIADKIKRINLELQQKKEDIEKANFSPERKQQVIAEYESRAARISQFANRLLKTKLDDYSCI